MRGRQRTLRSSSLSALKASMMDSRDSLLSRLPANTALKHMLEHHGRAIGLILTCPCKTVTEDLSMGTL